MKVLYIYRNSKMGFSIGKVFKPIEQEMQKYCDVDSIELPCSNYNPQSMWRNILFARKALKKKHYDIVHVTGAEHYLLPFLRKERTVVTVHDLGFFTNHKFGLRAIKKYFLWIRTLPLANYVTFISEKSEKEALRLVRLKDGKHSTVLNPVGGEFISYPKTINTGCPVILHVGTKENKNLESTAIALKGFPCKIRIVGNLTEGQKLALKLYGIDYEQVSNLTNEEILQEYINCDYVNFPSLYEGFGMPIIEGQAIGRPVLTSNLSPMKEVAGNAAILVDPTKPEDIRRGYEAMKQQAEELVESGFENVKRFALAKITQQYLEVYKRVVEHR
mgnify:CR=1 FL=1